MTLDRQWKQNDIVILSFLSRRPLLIQETTILHHSIVFNSITLCSTKISSFRLTSNCHVRNDGVGARNCLEVLVVTFEKLLFVSVPSQLLNFWVVWVFSHELQKEVFVPRRSGVKAVTVADKDFFPLCNGF